jgi:hypothetical protein
MPFTDAMQDILVGLAIIGAVAGALIAITWEDD